MGLDITAYEKVERIDPQPEKPWSDELYDEAIHVFAYAAFEHALNGLPYDYEKTGLGSAIIDGGWYRPIGEAREMRAGSYGGYNKFREALAAASLGVPPNAVWDSPEKFITRPFFELIHFADNEGCLSSVVCSHLAADFAKQREHVLPKWDPAVEAQAWYRDKYDGWQELVEFAADGGLVVFS